MTGTKATLGAIDPVCGMTVDSSTAVHRLEHSRTAYYFCGAGCAAQM